MSDKPYDLDFFQKIIDTHWDGPWMVLYGIANAGVNGLGLNTDATIEFGFPGFSAGTPGFTLISGHSPEPPDQSGRIFLQAPSAITVKALQGKLRTHAGWTLTGFSIGASTTGQGTTQPECAYFINLAKFPRTTKFAVRGYLTSNNIETIFVQCAVLLYKKAPKVGTIIGKSVSGGVLLTLPPDTANYYSGVLTTPLGSSETDFVVDQVNGTVTGTP